MNIYRDIYLHVRVHAHAITCAWKPEDVFMESVSPFTTQILGVQLRSSGLMVSTVPAESSCLPSIHFYLFAEDIVKYFEPLVMGFSTNTTSQIRPNKKSRFNEQSVGGGGAGRAG